MNNNLQTKSNLEILYKGHYQDNWLNRKLKRVGQNYSTSIGINKYSNKRYSDIELLHGEIESFSDSEIERLNKRFSTLFVNNPRNIEFQELKSDLNSFSIDYKMSVGAVKKKLQDAIKGLESNGVRGYEKTQKLRLDNLVKELRKLNSCVKTHSPYKITVKESNRALITKELIDEHNNLVDTMNDIISKMGKLYYKSK